MDKIFNKVFMWLAIGLLISFGVGYAVSTDITLVENIFDKYFFLIILLELALAFILGLFIRKLSKVWTIMLYILYSAVTGLTLSSIFLAFEISSIAITFLSTSIIFVLLSIYGYTTKKDITKIGTILFFTLIGEIILVLLNILIFKSSTLDIISSALCLIVFMGYIIYDINIIKRRMYDISEDKLAVYGAFQLYLDFINIFIELLRIFGKSKD